MSTEDPALKGVPPIMMGHHEGMVRVSHFPRHDALASHIEELSPAEARERAQQYLNAASNAESEPLLSEEQVAEIMRRAGGVDWRGRRETLRDLLHGLTKTRPAD